MILYHVSTTYHLLCAIVHKLVFHKEEPAQLLIVEYLYARRDLKEFQERLKNTGWFDSIRIVPEGELAVNRGKKLTKNSSFEMVMKQAEAIAGGFSKWFGEDITQYEEINLLGEQWSFGIYILYHHIPHNYFEDGSGLLGDYKRYFQVVRDINMTNYILLRHLGGGGRNSFVLNKFCDKKNQPPLFHDKKAKDFCIFNYIEKNDFREREELFGLFHANPVSLPEGAKVAIFLTQFIRTLTIQSFEVQQRITTLILDYFYEGDILLIKPHPKDKWIDYKKLYPEAIIIDKRTPSEFLPLLLNRNVDLTITASSTSVGGMSFVTDDVLSFGPDIESEFMRLHTSYVLARMVSALTGHFQMVMTGKNSSFLSQFLKYKEQPMQEEIESGKGKLIVDAQTNPILGTEDGAIFTEGSTHYQFLLNPRRDLEGYLVVTFELHNMVDEYETYQEEIWLYSQNVLARKDVMSLDNERYELKKTGQVLSIHVEEATQIQMEKGKNRAMRYVLEQKSNEDRDRILGEMNALVGLYQKESAMFNRVLADEGCETFE